MKSLTYLSNKLKARFRKSRVLFISHEASKTGAPIVLLELLKWLRQNTQLKFDILLKADGPLREEFEQLGQVILYSDLLEKTNLAELKIDANKVLVNKTADKTIELFLNSIKNYSTIYTNTIASVNIGIQLKKLASKKTKLIAHIHELTTIIKLILPNFQEYEVYIDYFITPSKIVKKNLIETWNIASKKISVVHAFSKQQTTITSYPKEADCFYIGGSGTVHWRKGDDLFIQTALFLRKKYPNLKVKFIWVGSITEEKRIILEADLKKTGLTDIVEFVGEQENPFGYYNNFDLFLMTSREDPFPLVCIEVGKLGVPIICFKGATGTAEIIKEKGGFIIPYLDTEAMAEKVAYYINHPQKRQEDGWANQQQFSVFSPEVKCPEIYKIISTLLEKK